MSDVTRTPSAAQTRLAPGLAPLFAIVFLGFLSVGAPLPAIALYVHGTLGYSSLVVGVVIGIQSLATVLTRHGSGTLCDQQGARRAVLLGLPLASVAGLLYGMSATVGPTAEIRLAFLIAGRIMLGLGESLFVTGALAWGIGRIGPARTGTVMSWQGIALYAALGAGAPLGLAVQAQFGFQGVAILTILVPLLALLVALALPPVPASRGQRAPFYQVIGLIWRPGMILMLATVPFAAMATFLALQFAGRGWPGAGLALLGFGAGYVAVRLVGSHWPDRFGGARVAAASLAIETAGQALLWLAPAPGVAAAGAVLTGIGFSLVFPAMGVEATRRVRPDQRGSAVGNFTAFFDVAIGTTGPVVGLAVTYAGSATAFLVGAACPILALAMLPGLKRMGSK